MQIQVSYSGREQPKLPANGKKIAGELLNHLKGIPLQTKISSAFLVASNLSSIAGMLWWGWDAASILFAYWAENAVIGVFTVAKMSLARGTPAPDDVVSVGTLEGTAKKPATRGILVPFFMLHFGVFMLAHLFILVTAATDGNLEKMIGLLSDALPLVALLFASHGISFAINFVGRREFERAPPSQFMFAPYPRVIVMHLAVMFSFVIGLSAVVLVLLKTLFDLAAHIYEHAEFGKPLIAMGTGTATAFAAKK